MYNFVLQTSSLQRLAAVKIVTHLWSQPDIITRIATSFHALPHGETIEYTTQWQEIEKKVQSKASVLTLPIPCKQELSDVILPIGMEVIVWCRYHNLDSYPFNFLDKLLPLQFCWTMQGTVDYAKTAEVIVKDERVDVVRRFEVACLNCLEDEARQLFQFLPNHRMHKYISEAVRYESMDHRILVTYFACTLSGDEDLLTRLFQAMDLGTESINEYLFTVALYRGNRATCEYFFQKVSQAEKDQLFEEWETLEDRDQECRPTCGLMFYLSRANEELFGECTANVLISLLRWPMQSLFVEATKRVWQFMFDSDYAEVLENVIVKIINGYTDFDYAQLFWQCWRSTLAEHKHLFLDDMGQLLNLIATKQTEFIQLCLNQAPSHQLRELVESRYEEISEVLKDERVISDAALVGCRQAAILDSSKDRDNAEKRLRSEHLRRLVDTAMESRLKSREKCRSI